MDYRPFGLLDLTPGMPAGGVSGRTPTGADDLGRLAYSMTGAGGAQDAVGLLGGPSIRENLRAGNNFDAGLQMLAALPVVGMLGSAPRAVGKVARGAQDAAKAAEEARGIIAYHGSPHSFDKFDLSKIGTGEGAQAYGHGLYFAESEPVARSYRDALAVKNDPREGINNLLDNVGFGVQRGDVESHAAGLGLPNLSKAQLDDIYAALKGRNSDGTISDSGLDAIRRLDRSLPPAGKGSMYQVRINADPNAFLDWDKPLSEQSPYVKDTLNTNLTTLRDNTSIHRPRTPEDAKRLREAGIPGIKYLDQGSRGAGEGSRNYVVFDDSLIDILKKYGLIGLLGGGAAASGVSGMNTPPAVLNSAPGL